MLKLETLLDQLCHCFQDPFLAKSQSDLTSSSVNPVTLVYAVPLCLVALDLILVIVRQLVLYFRMNHVNYPPRQKLEHGLLLFSALGRSWMQHILKLIQWIHQFCQQQETPEYQALKAYLNRSSVSIKELLSFLDLIQRQLGPVTIDEIIDLFVKQQLPNKVLENVSLMTELKKWSLEDSFKLFEADAAGKPKSAEIISPASDANQWANHKQQMKATMLLLRPMALTFPWTETQPPRNASGFDVPLTYSDQLKPSSRQRIETLQAGQDGITHLSLRRVPVIRQCSWCGHYAAAYVWDEEGNLEWIKAKRREPEGPLTKLMQKAPWSYRYVRRCYCGGPWLKVMDLRT